MKSSFVLCNKLNRALVISFVAFILSFCFLIVFFVLAKDLPQIVPVHFSNGVGIDGWGNKSELYPIPIIPAVFGVLTVPVAVVCSKKDVPGFSYFASGVSLFATLLMALVAAVFLKAAGV